MTLRLSPLPLSGLYEVVRIPREDERGWFERLYCADELRSAGWRMPIAQVNRSFTRTAGTVRGLHFQYPPHQEMKLITCLRGAVWDVVVDVRKGSNTFLKWHGCTLHAGGFALLVPEGFAHGFQALTNDAELLYVHSRPYSRSAEGGLHVADPALSISWPLPLHSQSERDQSFEMIGPDFSGVEL
ncbi:dTDP-4-dehydrorhamnose 3,5-epimerase family protein [Curvibacter sp. APW13]|uniref:dTDP-4-dehydrorhamnose 3,5-epimerase family protein n=1 Tax=Curvibacter sp. APW13 TaxID=3077236 RepID=UPI0028DFF85F|nr:dTDP-4-dehydrorhamnose 3,5-epimerase family protein [Curvibacter sp. APW13]MDT8993021.1 dTDP-4-dehydrorhamnose 3,5-epimerase family protein [Curvibacter sp. APW13]